MILVTGSQGSVGKALLERLDEPAVGVDIDEMDVTRTAQVLSVVHDVHPKLIFHLAGAKHAFEGELEPDRATDINVFGTRNILLAAEQVGAKVIFSSTCKACDPETAYGASKLIAERMVLNAGGVVVRYYNIIESAGNVFRIWEQIPESEPIPYTDCWRYFISMDEALDLTIAAMDIPVGRYACDPGMPQHMQQVARNWYPRRETIEVPRRRGDRYREPLHAECESMVRIGFRDERLPYGRICEISSPYDVKRAAEIQAAA